ncbi:MAG TPA: hypothetical protein VHP34_04210, partial [Alphaproteobacteria bacterium]|nr:hypothetical protein [Alphaproteobacteria bacterium]
MKTERTRKIYYLSFFVFFCLFAGLLYSAQKGGLFKGASKKIVEKEYTDPEREAFILNSLLNAKWPPPEKTVFKFPEVVSVGFGWSRKSVLSSPHIYQRGGTPGRVYEIFYEPLEKELKEFLPQLED